jgi:initiation factor 1A
MVKNTFGGNKHKGQARKLVTSKQSSRLRTAEEEGEIYAQVTKMLGNGMCQVICIDDQPRLCFIRGKFKGRGKRDNTLKTGTWVLIGLREWNMDKVSTQDALQKCDLLEVYTDLDKERLKKTVSCKWSLFIENDAVFTNTLPDSNISFDMEGDASEEYKLLMETELKNTEQIQRNLTLKLSEDDENNEINIDDI